MMEWTEEGIVLGSRTHGETSAIAEILTRDRGRWLGLVHGGRSRRTRPILQPGNVVEATWRARLDEHLGRFTIEPERLRAASLMQSRLGIYGVQTLCAHLRLLPERDAHARLYDQAAVLMDHLSDPARAGELMIRFEVTLLDELGVGLDLSRCAATGETNGLEWVSPRTGRAVGRESAQGYEDRLLALPAFLAQRHGEAVAVDELRDGFALTGAFLDKAVWTIRETPPPAEREAFVRTVLKGLT